MAARAALAEVPAIVDRARRRGPVVVVVSALAGVTDSLAAASEMAGAGVVEMVEQRYRRALAFVTDGRGDQEAEVALGEVFQALARDLGAGDPGSRGLALAIPPAARRDAILAAGERASVALVTAVLRHRGLTALPFPRPPIVTDSSFGDAVVDRAATRQQAQQDLGRAPARTIPVVAGFLGRDRQGRTTTLGRNGSDYSAALLAGFLDAQQLEIWSDVDGLLSADPGIVPEAQSLGSLSYWEAQSLADAGARVLDRRTLRALRGRALPVVLRNALRVAHPGTRILPGQDRLRKPAFGLISGFRRRPVEASEALPPGGWLMRTAAGTRLLAEAAPDGDGDHSLLVALGPGAEVDGLRRLLELDDYPVSAWCGGPIVRLLVPTKAARSALRSLHRAVRGAALRSLGAASGG